MTLDEEDQLRRALLNIVKQNSKNVIEVLKGSRVWSPQQVALYKAILSKVISDKTIKLGARDGDTRDIDELTDDELRIIAAGGRVTKTTEFASASPSPNLDPPVSSLLQNPVLPPDIEAQERANSEIE